MYGSKTIKITTPTQFAKLVDLMEKNPHLAKGYHHKSLKSINLKEEWNEIGEELNSFGPPFRTGEGWMKVWADFKFKLKKKLPRNHLILTAVEEAAVNLLGLHAVIGDSKHIGVKRPADITAELCVTADSSCDNNEIETPGSSNKIKCKNKAKDKFALLEQQVQEQALQIDMYQDIKNKLTEIERSTRKICKIKEEKFKLYKIELERKEEYRKQLLEIQKAKLEIKKIKVEIN